MEKITILCSIINGIEFTLYDKFNNSRIVKFKGCDLSSLDGKTPIYSHNIIDKEDWEYIILNYKNNGFIGTGLIELKGNNTSNENVESLANSQSGMKQLTEEEIEDSVVSKKKK